MNAWKLAAGVLLAALSRCVWFDKSKKMEDVFDIAVLKKYSDPGIGTVSVRRG